MDTHIRPDAAARNTEAPFLFKCCRVDYNKETNRLEIFKGEYVGKVVTHHRAVDAPFSEEDAECDDTLVETTDQTDLPGKCNRYVRKNIIVIFTETSSSNQDMFIERLALSLILRSTHTHTQKLL